MRTATAEEAERAPVRSGSGHRRRPRVGIATDRRHLAEAQPGGLAVALAAAGHAPIVLDPEDPRDACLRSLDLLVVRGRSPALLDLVWRAELLGVPVVHRCAAIAAVVDKCRMAQALAAAGLPAPPTSIGTVRALAARSRRCDFPMVVKPVFGEGARNVRVVRTRAELAALRWEEPLALAQPFVPSDGYDLKLYVVGSEVRAARKPSPIGAKPAAPAYEVPVTGDMRQLALRCGMLFGLELFGVDCLETAGGLVVLEVNEFPNYAALVDADAHLARHVLARARQVAACGVAT